MVVHSKTGPKEQEAAKVPNPCKQVMRRGKQLHMYQPFGQVNKAAFEWIVHHLKTHHDECLHVKALLELGTIGKDSSPNARVAAQAKESFHATYMLFEKLPLYWIADYFHSHLEMPKSLIDRIEDHRGNQLREMLEHFTGLGSHTRWPQALKNKELLVQFLDWLVERLGNRRQSFETLVDTSGRIDWQQAGPFKMTWDKSATPPIVSHIQPAVGADIKMTKAQFTTENAVTCAWRDLRARFVGEEEYSPTVASCFPKDAEFKTLLKESELQKKVDDLEAKDMEKRRVHDIGAVEVCTTSKKRRTDNLRKKAERRVPPTKIKTPLVCS